MKITQLALAATIALTLAACSPKSEAPKEPAQQTAAPAPTAQAVPGSFSIGTFPAISLRDGGFEFPNDSKIFGIGKTAEQVAEVLKANGQPTDKLSLTVDPLLVKTTDKVLLFDTGAGANFGASAGQIGKALAAAGVDAGSVTDIFISHAHGDHVGGLVNAEGVLAFPNATVHIGKADWAVLQGLTAESGVKLGIGAPGPLVAALAPKIDAFEPGADLLPGVVEAVEIRGHTPGHSGYLIGTGADSVLYIGDTMHHSIISVQKPDWTVAFDMDAATAQKSRNEVLARSVANAQRIYAVHFPFPNVGEFEKRGEGYVWIPE